MRRIEPLAPAGGHRERQPAGPPQRIVVVTRIVAVALTTLAATAVIASSVTAQVAWEGPRLLGATPPGSFGAHWVDYGTLPGDGMGVLITYAGPGLHDRAQLRGGFAEGAYGASAGFGGIDLWGPLAARSSALPLDLAWTTGVGAGVGEYAVVTVPIGVTAGRSWSAGKLWISPYVHTGVSIDFRFGDRAPEDEWGTGVAIDLGFLLSLDPARRYSLSASAGLGDRQAVAMGIVIR